MLPVTDTLHPSLTAPCKDSLVLMSSFGQINDAYVTEGALEAISAYRQACEDASEAVRQVLRSLSGRIAKVGLPTPARRRGLMVWCIRRWRVGMWSGALVLV
eukprot:3761770-Rhodomonas_salina.3